jgi:hypothetical protein
MAKLNHLRGALNSTKKVSLTIAQYFAKMKGFSSKLISLGKAIDDGELVGYIVNGLDGTYNNVVTTVHGNPYTTLDELYDQIDAHERRQSMLQDTGDTFTSSINLALLSRSRADDDRGSCRSDDTPGYRRNDDRGYRRWDDDRRRGDDDRHRGYDDCDRGYGRGRINDRDLRRCQDDRDDSRSRDTCIEGRRDGGRRDERHPTRYVDTTCHICKIHGHPASDCWWRYEDKDDSDDDSNHKDKHKGGHLASYGVDTNWYTDTGATNHITGELNKLSIQEKYDGRDRVHTANGTGMEISHIGYSVLHIPDSSLHLKNILHVPNA